MRSVRIALVHDWLTGMRGGERVLDVLARAYPKADIYTLIHRPSSVSRSIEKLEIKTSPLNGIPGIGSHYRKFLPLLPWAAGRLRPRGYDLVISVSHAVAKSVSVEPGTPHLCYCLTPMRYIWDHRDAYLGRGTRRMLAAPLVAALRGHDVKHASSRYVDHFVAISNTVRDRIGRHYGREATLVHPPVDVDRIRPSKTCTRDFYLLVGGFVAYKRDDLAVEAFRDLDRRLVVVGDGPNRRKLESRAPSNVEFKGRVGDQELLKLMQNCRALLYPQEEDFGIAAVEAQAAGRPVIAFQRGGVLDTVRPLFCLDADGRVETNSLEPATGAFFSEQNSTCLSTAIKAFEAREDLFDSGAIRRHAEQFSERRFLAEFSAEIDRLLEN